MANRYAGLARPRCGVFVALYAAVIAWNWRQLRR